MSALEAQNVGLSLGNTAFMAPSVTNVDNWLRGLVDSGQAARMVGQAELDLVRGSCSDC